MLRTGTALGLAVAISLPMVAEAQQACGDRQTIVARLEAKWGETFAGGGLQNDANVYEVWMSTEKGTWTILKTNANGIACVMATGTNWLAPRLEAKVAGVEG